MSLKYETILVPQLSIHHRRHDEHHRMDGPAMLWRDGDLIWEQYGEHHRINGPAYCMSFQELWFNRGINVTTISNNPSTQPRVPRYQV